MGFSFNKTNGEVIWKGPGFDGFVPGAATGFDPFEIDYVVTAGGGNITSAVGKFDNFISRASSSDTLLGVEEVSSPNTNVIKLYPNPVNDILSISTSHVSISNVEVVDINGRIVKSVSSNNSFDSKINVSDLSAGVYIINIYSENNKTTKKFVKN
jgi:hypothetical protein